MRVKTNPAWIMLPFTAVLVYLIVAYPAYRPGLYVLAGVTGLFWLLTIALRLLSAAGRGEVPASAVRELLSNCENGKDPDEWAIVSFKPGESLEQVRLRISNPDYSAEDRLSGFMFKFNALAATNLSVAVYYAARKGILAGKVGPIKSLIARHGAWKLDNWNCLVGALHTVGLQACSLDGPQKLWLR